MCTFGDRIIVLIDMDCFFCQVETKLRPEYKGKPLAVVQYTLGKSGGIIAVNYEAREHGVTRHMRGDEAKEKCPEIELAIVPSLRGKADTSRYRSAGREVIEVLKKHCSKIERASVDEAYLDITQIVEERMSTSTIIPEEMVQHLHNTFIVGYSEDEMKDEVERHKYLEKWLTEVFDEFNDSQAQKLAVAGIIVEEIRADIYEKTEFRCSAGISYNKILAKLACGLHKPNKQTILPAAAVPSLFKTLPIKKVRNLGGKFGDIVIESLKCNVMADLVQFSLQYLQDRFDEKTGLWLYNIARGIDNEPVTTRLVSKSIGACKKFPGKQAIRRADMLKHWTRELAAEICERLEQDSEENERRATLLTVSYQYQQNDSVISQSRSVHLSSYKHEKVASQYFDIVSKSTQQPIVFLGLSAGKFIRAKGSENFINFFKADAIKPTIRRVDENITSYSDEKDVSAKNECSAKSPSHKQVRSFFINANNIEPPKKERVVQDQDSLNVDIDEVMRNSDQLKKSFFMNVLKGNQEKEKEKSESTSKSTDTTNNSIGVSENVVSVRKNSNQNINVTVKLQEIFPDLDNIDPSILSCLPVPLQKEASELLRKNKSFNKNLDSKDVQKVAMTKNGKRKVQKQSKSVNSINNFLIKASVNNQDGKNFQKCPQCGQSISIDKYVEHNDFHLAQSLQKVISKPVETETIRVKRKNSQNSVDQSPKKRQAENLQQEYATHKSIASFFP